jgi:murein DD-endopeptidase MepM/ murein hydrolase activator NlpD
VDFFYPYVPAVDPPMKVGDGGATRGADGKPKWWIPPGTLAIAAAAGKVIRSGRIETGGRIAIAHSDGMQTIYVHLKSLLVKEGDEVYMGQPLGEPGDNPRDIDATHLHFEVSPLDTYAPINPAEWLKLATYLP